MPPCWLVQVKDAKSLKVLHPHRCGRLCSAAAEAPSAHRVPGEYLAFAWLTTGCFRGVTMPWSGFWKAEMRLCTFRKSLRWTPGAVCEAEGWEVRGGAGCRTPVPGSGRWRRSLVLRNPHTSQGRSQPFTETASCANLK